MIRVPRELLESLVEDNECDFDHHGGCQGHNFIGLVWGEECPQAQLKRILANQCPTPCDPDCDASCHEGHLPIWHREHNVEECDAKQGL